MVAISSKPMRSKKKSSIFLVSCCTVLFTYVVVSTCLHSTLSFHESISFQRDSENTNIIERAKKSVDSEYEYESKKVTTLSLEPKISIGVANSNDTYKNENADVKNLISEPWSHPTIHVVTSRFMQGQAHLIHLTKARLELFQAICLPSIVGQDRMDEYLSQLKHQNEEGNEDDANGTTEIDPPFLWIIKVDPDTDKSVLSKMIELVEPFPNFFLVGIDINDTVGKWKEDQTKNKLLQGTVYSGDVNILHRAHHFRNDKISLETRLDADDGLHRSYLKTVGEQAMESLRKQTKQSSEMDEKKADWKVWCARWSLEWFPEPPKIKNSHETNEIGSVLPSINNHLCLSAGLTTGISVGVKTSEVPTMQHQQILNAALSQKLKCGLNDARKCVKLVTDPQFSALRARTITSAGMMGIKSTSDSSTNSSSSSSHSKIEIFPKKIITLLVDNFHLNVDKVRNANQYFTSPTNIVDIASENLRGQCTKGHSCKKSSKEKLQKIIELGGKLWD